MSLYLNKFKSEKILLSIEYLKYLNIEKSKLC